MDKTPMERETRLREALSNVLAAWYGHVSVLDLPAVYAEAQSAITESEAATALQPFEITDAILHRIMPRLAAEKRAEYLPHLNTAMRKFEINTPLRAAAFLAQLAHESGEFRYFEEIWGPTEAQERYEGRKDLGNTEPGDGYRFRGRGPIQLTGRANYKKHGNWLGVDFVANPDLAAQPEYAFQTAGMYWILNSCNALADKQDFRGITRAINGGLNGLAGRERYYAAAKEALSVQPDAA